ncbi:hypothetical protein, conserved [Leishmania tarentolae]|uniref:CS domain-containing protein n=1 Tax=Leishmania tarentolae TaxID=5689 RepID=A0A640KQS7_LEITA|nr:hypothetical protein, conserved [Leishmania tarentolae]
MSHRSAYDSQTLLSTQSSYTRQRWGATRVLPFFAKASPSTLAPLLPPPPTHTHNRRPLRLHPTRTHLHVSVLPISGHRHPPFQLANMSTNTSLVPPISWAQRPEYVLITIPLQDTTGVNVEIKNEGRELHFACSAPEQKQYAYTIQFYGAISSEESQHVVRPRQIELRLRKKFTMSLEDANDDEVEWPRLTKEKVKCPNITIDWSKWKDENDDECASDDLGDFGLGGGDEVDGKYSEMLSQLMQAQGKRDAEESAGLPPGTIPEFGSAQGQGAADGASAEAGDDDADMPPLEADT